ncbi:MAG: SufE family protein [Hyphomicrobium sp.]
MTLAEIRADFSLLDDWEDRYRYIIELGRALPEMPAELKTDSTKVRGCTSQVWLHSRLIPGQSSEQPRLEFQGDSDAHIVRGLVAILLAIYNNRTADEIANHDALADFASIGLQEHLTPQRSNGLAAMVARARSDARAAVNS